MALWDVGLDYLHGTGHGIGSFLNVHEGNLRLHACVRACLCTHGLLLATIKAASCIFPPDRIANSNFFY